MTTLEDKVVVITGAAGNLGRAVADSAHEAGGKTVLVDRSQARLQSRFVSFSSDSNVLLCGGIDLTSEDDIRRLVESTIKRFGRIDGLVNTAGGFRGGPAVYEEELSTWDLMMTMNLRTTLLMCRAVIPTMLSQSCGAIVNVAAGAALAGSAGLAAYSASKVAVMRLAESLSNEVKLKGIRVNTVLPGTIDTPENREAMPDADTSSWVKPADIANVIAFLVSDSANAVTGASIPVFGRG